MRNMHQSPFNSVAEMPIRTTDVKPAAAGSTNKIEKYDAANDDVVIHDPNRGGES